MDRQAVARELTLAARELTAGGYAIEEGGLRKIGPTGITLEPGAVYALGASSSPSLIIVTGVNDKFITYRSYPYATDNRIERWVGEDLIQKGTNTWLKTRGKYFPEFAASMRSGLGGGTVKRFDVDDFEHRTVYARPVGGTESELWRQAEQYGNVGFMTDENVFEIDTDGFRLKELAKDKNFEIVRVVKR